ncbi:hypothetical protein [Rhizosaccharibacter radicis]|uniref:Uncharacterized protein n=1 Tax=Rhizosaccharibacter radicis TaxID=2782605 RepID=A0ABT1VTA8_9PROT|nr:hypothetical protein [Acetobacteraceae bacterium KSS12]
MLEGLFDIVAGRSTLEFIGKRFRRRPTTFFGWVGWLIVMLTALGFLAMLAFGLI